MKSQISSSVVAVGAILFVNIGLRDAFGAEPIEFRSPETKSFLVELFTSEGCSSCPPAERWISELKTNPRLWKDYVVLAFHVDYWDGLGWKDPFARREFTARQQSYSDQSKIESVYTPGFEVDGKEWRGWFNREPLPESSNEKAGVLVAKSDKPGVWELRYTGSSATANQNLTFSAALLGFGLKSKVRAGENSGRTLEHDFVVLKFGTTTAENSNQYFQGTISMPVDASLNSKRSGMAFWISNGTSLQPLQAVGGWLD